MTITGWLFKLARLSADARAVRKGRIVQRVENKIIGRVVGKLLRKVWR